MAYVISLITVCHLPTISIFYLALCSLSLKNYSFKMTFKVILANFSPITPTLMSVILFSFWRSQVWVLNFKSIKCFNFAPNVIPFLIHLHEDTHHPNLGSRKKNSQGVGFSLAMRKRLSMCCK